MESRKVRISNCRALQARAPCPMRSKGSKQGTPVAKHSVLSARIPANKNLQAWFLHLYCAAAKPKFIFGQWHHLSQRNMHLHMTIKCCFDARRFYISPSTASLHWHKRLLPFIGRLALRNTIRLCGAAHWSNLAKCSKMVQKSHPCGNIFASVKRDDQFPFVQRWSFLHGKIWLSKKNEEDMLNSTHTYFARRR